MITTLTRQQAIDRLTHAIEHDLDADAILELYDELHIDRPTGRDDADRTPAVVAERLLAYIRTDFEPEELISLWWVVFPRAWSPTFDEDDDSLTYSDTPPQLVESEW